MQSFVIIYLKQIFAAIMGICLRYSPVLLILFLSASCATIGALGGGPKDVTPPKVMKAVPENYSRNFSGDHFTLYFNEYVDIKDPANQVIISPPLAKTPEFKIKKKSLTLNFQEKLKENTTYNINFTNSVVDITEQNPMDNYQYTFSTGNVIDSLFVTGRVLNAYNLLAEKGNLVMLYQSEDDSVPYKQKPFYLAKTDINGNFRITNVKDGLYKVIALKDVNHNFLYETSSESIGFVKGLLRPQSVKKDSLDLRIFQEDKKKQGLLRASSTEFGKILFAFNSPVQHLKYAWKENTDNPFFTKEMNKTRDTLILWYTNIIADTATFILRDTNFSDTVKVALMKKEGILKEKGAKGKTKSLLVQSNLSSTMDLNANINFTVQRPATDYDFQKITLTEDSTRLDNYIVVAKDSASRRFSIAYPWKENSVYRILIPRGTFADAFGLVNDTLKTGFKIKPESSYGSLTLKAALADTVKEYIVQLVDEKENIIRENTINASQNIEYQYLAPAKYRIKVIFDTNSNGKWDTGDYLRHMQPEKVAYFKDILAIRANWELEVDWNISENK